MMQDNSKLTIFSVKNEWEMSDLAHELQNTKNVVYHVIDKNKFFTQMPDGIFVEYGYTTLLKPNIIKIKVRRKT